MDKVVLGKYTPYHTIIHRLDPRMKILGLIMMTVAIFLNYGSWATIFVLSAVNATLIFIFMLVAKVRLRDLLYQLRSMLLLIIILLTINIFLPPSGSVHIIAQNGGFTLYAESFLQTAKIILRIFEMLAIAMVLTATTTPQQLTQGFAWFIKPLKKIKFPSEEIAMTISIALRFIPTLLEETNRIHQAQASRGVDYRQGSLKMKIKGIVALIVPLFISAFMMSDDLAYALEARGYNPRANRTEYRLLHWRISDTIAFLLIAALMAMFITFTAMNFDFMRLLFPQIW